MKKLFIASAVAALTVPFAAQADTTVSGSIALGIQGGEANGDVLSVFADNVDVMFATSGNAVGANTAYAGFEIEPHTLSASLDAIEIDAVKVGITGDFGDLSIGDVGLSGGQGVKAWDKYDATPGTTGGISYAGSAGSVSYKIGFAPEGNNDGMGIGLGFSAGSIDIGLDFGSVEGSEDVVTVGAAMSMDSGLSLAAHFQTQDDADNMAFTAGYSMSNGVSLGLNFASATDVESAFKLTASKSLGDSTSLSAAFESNDPEAGDGMSGFNVILSQSF